MYISSISRLFVLYFFLSSIAYANSAESDYLDELSQEAESTSHVQKNHRDKTSVKRMAKMELQLEATTPSTFKYYQRLGSSDRLKVFGYFDADSSDEKKKISNIRKKIMDLYFK
ncbi:MAG: hypothetical protein ACC707_07265 [Thiohalomonadales bacterium]